MTAFERLMGSVTCGAIAALSLGLCGPARAQAQSQAPTSQLQLTRSDAGGVLAKAMSDLATNPRDLNALLMAGEAALQLEDPRSALGFFGRADDISPNNGRVKAGLGRSMLQLEQVVDGLRLMEEAGRLGYSDAALLADRGLARDLSGNQAGAQQDYVAALKLDPKNETYIRRYAVSLGISGNVNDAEMVIQPLLYASNRAAWRDRAFILAMNGRRQEATDITSRVMPKPLADAIKPYMDRMTMLKPGQQAAAVHFGQFPPGLVNMRIASTAVPAGAAPATAASTAKPDKKRKKTEQVAAAKPAPVKAEPASQPKIASASPQQPAPVRQAPQPQPAPAAVPPAKVETKPVVTAAAPQRQETPATAATSKQVQGPTASGQSVAAARSVTQTAPAQPPEPAPQEPGESTRTLADIMSEIKIPEAERQNDVTPVNLAEVAAMQEKQRKAEAAAAREAARKKAEEEARAKAKAEEAARKKLLADNPARYWLQVGVGRDTSAHAFTMRQLKKQYDSIADYDGWWAQMGQTKRIVVGPFSNLDKAKQAEAAIRKQGSDGYVWRSDAGEIVTKIGK